MKKIENNFKNIFFNFIGLTSYAFLSFFLLIICKYVNGLDSAGVFSYSFSLCSLLYIVSNYYSRTFQISKINNDYDLNAFLNTRILTSIISLFVAILICIISGFDSSKTILIFILLFYRIIDSISDMFCGYIQYENKLYLVGISLFLKSVVAFISFLVVDIMTHSLIYSSISLIVSFALGLVYDLINFKSCNIKDKLDFKLDFKKIIGILKESLPIFLFAFLSIFLFNCQKYILTYYVSNSLQTIFGIIIMPATMLSLVGNYLINPALLNLNNAYHNKDIKLFKSIMINLLKIYVILSLVLLLAAWFLEIPLLNIIYSIDLNEYKISAFIIIIGAIFSAVTLILSSALIIINENKKQLFSYIITSIITFFVSIFLISKYQIVGGSIAFFISMIINLIIYIIIYINSLRKWEKSYE